MVFAKAVALGSIASVLAVLFAFRFEGFSRAVFIVDGLLLLLALAGSRTAFRLFRKILPTRRAARDGRRVLIYGAGDAGDLLLREILNNHDLQYAPVGFVDDDPLKKVKSFTPQSLRRQRCVARTAPNKTLRKCSFRVRVFPRSALEKFSGIAWKRRSRSGGCESDRNAQRRPRRLTALSVSARNVPSC